MENACIIGNGKVGSATARIFSIEKYYDSNPDRCNITLEEASKYRYIFVCLPTPTKNGLCQTDHIKDIVKQIHSFNKFENIFIIRSTVTPGFADALMETMGTDNVVSNPEFLSEDTLEKDIQQPDLVVLGAKSPRYLADVKGLYTARYPRVKPVETSNTTAEMIKYSLNAFFSLKVIYSNELFDMCQKNGAYYKTIQTVLETHPWGSKNHWVVWYKGKRGLHGACLPKDLDAFSSYTGSALLGVANVLAKDGYK